jgi:hypothetical protein
MSINRSLLFNKTIAKDSQKLHQENTGSLLTLPCTKHTIKSDIILYFHSCDYVDLMKTTPTFDE